MASQGRAGTSNSKPRAAGPSKTAADGSTRPGPSTSLKPAGHKEKRTKVAAQPSARPNTVSRPHAPEDDPPRRRGEVPVTQRNAREVQTEKVAPADPKATSRTPIPATNDAKPTTDSVLAVAHLYPWIFMTSETQMQHESTQRSMVESLENRAQELVDEEHALKDSRIRFQAVKLLDLTDELNACQSELAPLYIQFLDLEHKTTHAISNSSEFAKHHTSDPVDALRHCRDVLNTIEDLQEETSSVHDRISLMETSSSPGTRIRTILEGMLRILVARIDNLSVARQLMLVHQENVRIRLRTDSISCRY